MSYSHQMPTPSQPRSLPPFPLGSEVLMSAKLIHDMRAHIDDVALSPRQRQAVESAISRVEKHWQDRKMADYQAGVERRDRLHGEVVQLADDARAKTKELTSQVEAGLLSPREARSKLRDLLGYHAQMVEQHNAVNEMEPVLAAKEAMPAADYQAECFQRFGSDRQSSRPLGEEVRRYLNRPGSGGPVPDAPSAADLTHPDA